MYWNYKFIPIISFIFNSVRANFNNNPNNNFNNGCLIASNFQLNYNPQSWWSCSKHVADCFDELTSKLRSSLTDGRCKGHACYSKDSNERLQQQSLRLLISPSPNWRRMNGCAVPQFNVGMERLANSVLQKGKGCLLDLEEYELLLEKVMEGMRIERDCFLQANPLLTQQLLQMHQANYYSVGRPGTLTRYAYPREKFNPRKCLLPPVVEMTLRMRLQQLNTILKPGRLAAWQEESAKGYFDDNPVNSGWAKVLKRDDLRDPQLTVQSNMSKQILEKYLLAVGCSVEPYKKWKA